MALVPGAPMQSTATDRALRLQALPGLRTLASARFRCLLAAVLWLIGLLLLGSYLARSLSSPGSQTAIDFADYRAAAGALAAGASPYAPEMLQGPVPAQGLGAYRYPPMLAQLLVPVAALPLPVGAALWFGLQAAAALAATWIAGTAGGARPSLERLLWTGVATTYFLPVFDSLWKGNVSGFMALAVGMLLAGPSARAGIGLAMATLVKLTPAALWLALAGARRGLVSAVATLAALGAVSVLLSSQAWREYLTVLPNLLAGSADYPTNLAPAALIATRMPDLAWLAPHVRVGTLVGGALLMFLGLWLSRRREGWGAAIAATAAGSLLVPAAAWYHYLAILLPLAAFAWPRATLSQRISLLAGSALVFAGFGFFLPLALPGACLLVATTLLALWPRGSGVRLRLAPAGTP